MGATESRESQLIVDEFVRQKLIECNCQSVLKVFVDNEIDEAAFRLLSDEDLNILLPDKLGPRKKICALIQRLRCEALFETDIDRHRGIHAGTSQDTRRIVTKLNIKNDPEVNSVNCSKATLSASSELLPPTTQKRVHQDPQQSPSFSSKEMTVAIPSELEIINADATNTIKCQNNIGISQHGTSIQTSYLQDATEVNILQSTSVHSEVLDSNAHVSALANFSSQASSSSFVDTADVTIQQSTPAQTSNSNRPAFAPLANSSSEALYSFHTDNNSKTSQSTSMQTDEIDSDNPTASSVFESPPSLLEKTADTINSLIKLIPPDFEYKNLFPSRPFEYYHYSMPETSDPPNNVGTDDKPSTICEPREKEEEKQEYQNHYKGKTESTQQSQAKRSHGKGKNYNHDSSSHRHKFPIPHKIIESRKKLPIYKYKEQFLNLVKQNSVVIVIAETGSGKSTQMPQYLAKDNYDKKIICTQPRRLAAKSLARRVAIEYGSKLGTGVGYRVRFDNCSENTTKISYVTEGVLIHELVSDVRASNYSVVIIDEAHERNLNTDVLLGCLKKATESRADLKLIISSATVEATKFSKFFNNAPVLDIPGRSHPVEIFYTGKPSPDYLSAVIDQVCRIHCSVSLGDVLVFLPGQEDIEQAADAIAWRIRDRPNPFVKEMVLPLFSRLPSEQQNIIFEPAPPNTRKIILATNIAETSLTIDGIVYVVDSGLVNQAEYTTKANSKALECTTLVTIPITKAQAAQRTGRAGRTQPGQAYRLYSEETYQGMAKSPVPEILRGNLEMVVLLLFSMGVKNILNFDFLDSPPKNALETALEKLEEFGALQVGFFGNRYTLTSLGRQMSGFPIEPYLSKMLIMSADLGCSEEMLTIIAMLSAQVEKLFKRPKAKKFEADSKKKTFDCEQGDHITLLNVYNEWRKNFSSRTWCNDFFLDWRTLQEVYEIRCQLSNMLDEQHIVRKSCGDDVTKIQIAIASGSFRKIAWKYNKYTYYTFSNPSDEPVFIHPSSVLFSTRPSLVIYNSVIKTKKAYMSQVLEIEREYIEEYAGHFYQKLRKVMPS